MRTGYSGSWSRRQGVTEEAPVPCGATACRLLLVTQGAALHCDGGGLGLAGSWRLRVSACDRFHATIDSTTTLHKKGAANAGIAASNYWLDLFTGMTWRELRKAGAKISGFRERFPTVFQSCEKLEAAKEFLSHLKADFIHDAAESTTQRKSMLRVRS